MEKVGLPAVVHCGHQSRPDRVKRGGPGYLGLIKASKDEKDAGSRGGGVNISKFGWELGGEFNARFIHMPAINHLTPG